MVAEANDRAGVVFNRATLSGPKDAVEISANQDHVGSILVVTDDKGRRVNDPYWFPLARSVCYRLEYLR